MAVGYFKDYFEETTLHGFRYVVLNSTSGRERVSWLLTILSCMSIACFMISENLGNASKNPIATSIRRVPVHDVPFPAVTISGNYLKSPFRLFEHVFNNFEFDCAHNQGVPPGCMERTSQIRSDFHPFIRESVRANFEVIHSYFLLIKRNDEIIDQICRKTFHGSYHRMGPIRSLAAGIADAHANINSNITLLEDDLIKGIAKSFRDPMPIFVSELMNVVVKYNPDYRHSPYMSLPRCLRGLLGKDVNSTAFALAMFHTMGYADNDKIGLGTLLTNYNVFPYSHRSNQTDQQSRLSWNVEQIFSTMLSFNHGGNTKQFSTKHFFGYYGPDMLTHEIVPDISGSAINHQCDFTNQSNIFPQPCSSYKLSKCCHLEELLSTQRETVLGFMKYTVGPQTDYTMEESEIKDALHFSKTLNYFPDSHFNHEKIQSVDPTVMSCWFGTTGPNLGCPHLEKSFTSKGIGYTFNSLEFWSMYRKNKGNVAFYNQMIRRSALNHTTYHNIPVENHGRRFPLVLLVYMNDKNDERTSLTIHEPSTIADIHNEAINLVPGMVHDISVVPSAVSTDNSGLELSPPKRECNGKSESENLQIFKVYTQSACLFECQIKMAIRDCNCSTWDYPVYDDSVNYCTVGKSSHCFKNMMADTLPLDQCHCPNDCSMTQYNVKMTLKPYSAYNNDFFSFNNYQNDLSMRYLIRNWNLTES